MQPPDGDHAAFETALAALKAKLEANRWDEAGEAGAKLAETAQRCQAQGVVLSPASLLHAKELYERCLLHALAWGEALNQEAQTAGSSRRAFNTYSQG